MKLNYKIIIPITAVVLFIIVIAVLVIPQLLIQPTPSVPPVNPPPPVVSTQEPAIKTAEVVTGLSNPWDLTFINKDFFYYSQRGGEIRGHNLVTQEDFLLIKPENAYVRGEGGVMSIQRDVDFDNNHYLYNCLNVQGPAVNVVRLTISDDLKNITETQTIISDLPSNESGRHSGCRIDHAKDGTLFIGTGDTAVGIYPQDPKNLGGKVLRVDREGKGVEGNLSEPYDNRIFSYGHRNVQGIALFEEPINGVYGLTSEHGPNKDDELNFLKVGNFGWDPVPDYNESVPMTDIAKYPTAIPSIWSSGDPTIAISGMTILKGHQWKAWDGAVLMGVQKDKHVRLQTYDSNWTILRDEKILENFGRIRTVIQSPDGDLFFTTDNGQGKDRIVRVTPE